ncbi:MAG: LuxR family transcriptional regulator [Caldilinea sp. CFX5]|nr:LuxR family transcriptional regulator [Caldilinea sp. CFX5]
MADTTATPNNAANLAVTALLRTKLFAPQVQHLQELLPRPRLVERLASGLPRKLTLVSAPAGYGKTILLAQWIPQCGRRVAWLSLDESDNDLARFLTYVIAALQSLKADFGQAILTALQTPLLPPIERLITALVNEIIPLGEFVLVLDDYHLIHLQAIHAALNLLLNYLPPNIHLILLSRADPPLPLARLRGRSQMSELRAADLRFTLEEACAFFQQIRHLPLAADQVKELATRTEGWSAGLHLAALSLQHLDSADINRFINDFTGSHHDVFDYLVEEVLQQQPEQIHRFLLHTAILARFCGPLCDTVLGKDEGGRMKDELVSSSFRLHPSSFILEQLEHANLFLVPLDGRRHWYRYHHLFADFLRNRLTAAIGPPAVQELYRRASGWFEASRLPDEAIDYALQGHDFVRAARLVDSQREFMRERGEFATLLRWQTALPDSAFEDRPTLALNHAFTLALLDQFTAAERRLDAAARALHAAPVPDGDLLGQAAVVRTAIALQTDQPAAVTLNAGRQALELLPPSNSTWRGLAAMFLGVGYYAQAGDITAGYQTLVEAERICLAAGDRFGVINAIAHMAIALEIGGRLHESARISRENLRRAAEPYWQSVPLAAHASVALSRVLYERNELLAARDLLTEAVKQLDFWSLRRPQLNALVGLARVQHALGEPAQAHTIMADVVTIVKRYDLKQTYAHWAEHHTRMALTQGDFTMAGQWATAAEPTIRGDLNPRLEYTHITLALVYLAQGRLAEGERLLDRLLPAAEAAARFGRVIEILLLQALTLDAQGQRKDALNVLERALTRAETEGYLRTFVDLGPPMAALLRAAHAHTDRPAYIAKLLAAFPDFSASERQLPPGALVDSGLNTSEAPAIQNPKSQIQNLIEPLSVREREILALLAQGLTNPEIAQKIYISDQTVKVHTRNIYGKLGVNSRRAAVAQARALGLLT